MNEVLVRRDQWGGGLRMEVELLAVAGSRLRGNLGGGKWSRKEQWRGGGKRQLEGRRESALRATTDVLGDMRTEVGDVSLIRCAIDVGLSRAERRRADF